MRAMRVFSIAGFVAIGVHGGVAFAGNGENWLTESAFHRAQQKNFGARQIDDEPFFPFIFDRQPSFFEFRKPKRTYEQQRKRGAFSISLKISIPSPTTALFKENRNRPMMALAPTVRRSSYP
jgi:hypothetical protein